MSHLRRLWTGKNTLWPRCAGVWGRNFVTPAQPLYWQKHFVAQMRRGLRSLPGDLNPLCADYPHSMVMAGATVAEAMEVAEKVEEETAAVTVVVMVVAMGEEMVVVTAEGATVQVGREEAKVGVQVVVTVVEEREEVTVVAKVEVLGEAMVVAVMVAVS